MSKIWTSILCAHHKEWVDIVRSFGEHNYCEDIVQEMYIRIYDSNSGEKAIIDLEPNRAFIWVVLKNTYLNFYKARQRASKVCLDEVSGLSYEEADVEKHEAYEIIRTKIEKEITTWHLYDQHLFNIYKKDKTSMRDISKGANISLSSIFNSLKNCKKRLVEAVGEDYEDYINKEYHLIK